MQIVDKNRALSIAPIWRMSFRPFFLCGSAFAIIAMAIWILQLNQLIELPAYKSSLWWHIHEMFFGFAIAIILGFLLTAVQTWTGHPTISGTPLLILFLIWLSGRFFILFPVIPQMAIISIDLLLYPLAAWFLAQPIFKSGNRRNLFFVPMLMLFGFANFTTHVNHLSWLPNSFSGFYFTLFLLVTLLSVMGGRVIPFFTARRICEEKQIIPRLLELSCLAATWLSCVLILFSTQSPHTLFGIYFIALSSLHILRMSYWYPLRTLKIPLLWSLHCGYVMIPIGFLTYGLQQLQWIQITQSSIFHLFTVGALGILIIAMIARVSLGHTGRKLEIGKLVTFSFISLVLACIVRFLTAIFPSHYLSLINISAILWCIGFIIFVFKYSKILTRERADKYPG